MPLPNVCGVPPITTVCDAVGGIISGSAEAMTDGIGSWIAASMGDLAASAAELAATTVDATTSVDLSAQWFRDNYSLILPIGLTAIVGAFCMQLALAAWRQDGTVLRRALTGTITGVLFAFVAIPLTALALTIVDALSDSLFQAANTSLPDAVRRVVKVSLLGPMHELGWVVTALMALALALGCFIFWGVMLFRKVGILILVTLAPFAAAGGGWDVGRRWRRGWIELTATLVFSKLLMTVIFLLGVSAISQTEPEDGIQALSDALAGVVVMAMALLAPFLCYKFVRWAGESGAGGEDLHRGSASSIGRPARTAQTAARTVAMAKTGGLAGGLAGRRAASPQGPTRPAGMPATGVVTPPPPGGRHRAGAPTSSGIPPEATGTAEPASRPGATATGPSGPRPSSPAAGDTGAGPATPTARMRASARRPAPPPPPQHPPPQGD
jgi:uncharacterized membrane protein (DUF373 family)